MTRAARSAEVTEAPQDKVSARKAATGRMAAKRAAKAAAKAARKGTAPIVPDQVAEKVGSASSWVDEHQRALWIGLAIVGLGSIAWFSIAGHTHKQAHEAAALLKQGLDALTAPVVAAGETPPEDADETFESEAARAEEAAKRLTKVAAHTPDAAPAAYAELARGNALLALHKYDDARAAYEKARAGAGEDAYLRWRSLEAIGFSLEAEGKHAQAAKRFAELEGSGPAYAPLGQYHRARMLAAEGKKEEATKLLQSLIAGEKEGEKEGDAANVLPSVAGDAELLLASLGGGAPAAPTKLRADLPNTGPTTEAAGAAEGKLTQQIVDSLREQLEAQEKAGGATPGGLTREIVEELQQKVKTGQTGGSLMKVPAPTPEEGREANPEAVAAPKPAATTKPAEAAAAPKPAAALNPPAAPGPTDTPEAAGARHQGSPQDPKPTAPAPTPAATADQSAKGGEP